MDTHGVTLYENLDENTVWFLSAESPEQLLQKVEVAMRHHKPDVCLGFDITDDGNPCSALVERESGFSLDESKGYWEVIHSDDSGEPFHEEFETFDAALEKWLTLVPTYIRPIAGTRAELNDWLAFTTGF